MTTLTTVRCPDCGGQNIPLPAIQAPPGYTFDGSKVLVTCEDCGVIATLTQCAVIEGGDAA